MRRLMIAVVTLAAGSPLAAAESCAALDAKGVMALFDDWNFALSSLDANQVVQRYWPNAVLLPTVSNTPRTTPAMIGDYFEHFLGRRPRGHIDTRTVQVGCNMAMDVGTYTFSMMDDKGVTSEVAARYTFIYQYRDGAWKILHHHSSAMPESAASALASDHSHSEKAPAVATPTLAVQDVKAAQTVKPVQPSQPVRPVQPATTKPVPAPVATPAPTPPKVAAREQPKAASPPAPSPVKPIAAPAAEAKSVQDTKTAMFANLASSPPPAKFYPPEAAKRKEHGSVNIRVCADGEGVVAGNPEVMKSSGSKLLDEAAMSWARAAKWVQATLNNHRVEGCTQIDVAFEAAA